MRDFATLIFFQQTRRQHDPIGAGYCKDNIPAPLFRWHQLRKHLFGSFTIFRWTQTQPRLHGTEQREQRLVCPRKQVDIHRILDDLR